MGFCPKLQEGVAISPGNTWCVWPIFSTSEIGFEDSKPRRNWGFWKYRRFYPDYSYVLFSCGLPGLSRSPAMIANFFWKIVDGGKGRRLLNLCLENWTDFQGYQFIVVVSFLLVAWFPQGCPSVVERGGNHHFLYGFSLKGAPRNIDGGWVLFVSGQGHYCFCFSSVGESAVSSSWAIENVYFSSVGDSAVSSALARGTAASPLQ